MSVSSDALFAAAKVIANVMRAVAAVRTDETAAAVNIQDQGDSMQVRAGEPGGPWGWEPIQAWMFEANAMHPLFGDKRHWYHQGEYPITLLTVERSIDDAANAYGEVMFQYLLDNL